MVQRWMARVIVRLDMIHIRRLLDTVNLPDIDAVAENVGVFTHRLRVTLEIDCVNFVIPYESLEEPDIRQGERVPSQELCLCKMLVKLFHVCSIVLNRKIISFLRPGKPTLVDPIVDMIVDPAIYGVHLFLKGLRCQVKSRVRSPFVELAIEHPDYFRGLVAHDRLKLFVPEYGYGVHAKFIIRHLVEVTNKLRTVERLWLDVTDPIGSESVPVGYRGVLVRKDPPGVLILARPCLLPCGVHN